MQLVVLNKHRVSYFYQLTISDLHEHFFPEISPPLFFIYRKLKPLNETAKDREVDTLIFPTLRKVKKMCLRSGYPKPPCTPEKKIVCYSHGHVWYIQKCSTEANSKTETCSCINGKGMKYILFHFCA